MTLSARSILCFPHKQETRNEVNSCLKGASQLNAKLFARSHPPKEGNIPTSPIGCADLRRVNVAVAML